MIEILTFIIVVIVIFGAVIENIRLKNKNVELMFLLTQSMIDLEQVKNKVLKTDDVEKDHLISFLSDTRDIAYKHIENVNNYLLEFGNILEREFSSPNIMSLSTIENAFNKLKEVFPEDIPDD